MQNEPLCIPAKNSYSIQIKGEDYTFQTGDKLYFTVKPKPDNDDTDSSALIKKNWTVGTDAEYDDDGYLVLSLSATDTDVAFGHYFFDIKLVNASASETLIAGAIHILPVATLEH